MHRRAVRRARRIGLFALLWAFAASGQTPEESLAPVPAPAGQTAPAAAAVPVAVTPAPTPGDAPASTASLIEQAWLAPAPDLDTRVQRTQRTALELGAWSLDAAAQSLSVSDASGSAFERASAAVQLAPDLPAAHMRLAQALWLDRGEPIAAVRAVVDALAAIGRHLEASLWFAGSGMYLLGVALVAAGLLAVALAGTGALAHAAHDLGHLLPGATPAFGRWAALAAVLALPLAAGEGLLGLALGLLGVAVIYGGRAQRIAMWIAALGIGIGAWPVMRYAGAALAALPGDPVAQATLAVAHGIPTPVEIARLASGADRDPLAARGLAIHARRLGDLARADALYEELIAAGADDVSTQNNAADVQLALGNTDRAIELYAAAAERAESSVVLFNLAQAYGRAFRVEELNQTIAHAQRADGELVARLTALQNGSVTGFVADLPPAPELFWARALRSGAGADVAHEFRARFAPGRLGRDPRAFAAVAAALALIGGMWAGRIQPSRRCQRCRERICRRCSAYGTYGEVCDACYTLFFAPEKTDRALRAARVEELRARERRIGHLHTAVSLLVPGAAGQLAGRPLLGWLGALCFALAIFACLWRRGVVPDPGVAGAAAPLVFLGTAAVAAIFYAIAVAASLAARRQE
jgi:tetratricopeptide (TPR) repeat protein